MSENRTKSNHLSFRKFYFHCLFLNFFRIKNFYIPINSFKFTFQNSNYGKTCDTAFDYFTGFVHRK